MKEFEVVDKGNKRFVLTVTPNRVTIKLQENSSVGLSEKFIKFLTWVSEQPDMKNCSVAFRGRTDVPPTDVPLMIQMVNDNGQLKHTYYEELNRREECTLNQNTL